MQLRSEPPFVSGWYREIDQVSGGNTTNLGVIHEIGMVFGQRIHGSGIRGRGA